jgi:hypothetical protein
MAWPSANPGNNFCTCLKKGDSLLKHNSLISTISWLSFLAPTQCHFSLAYLLQASTWGPCHPQPVSILGHAPLPVITPSDCRRLFLSQTFPV